jgi:hypothetical protein
MISLYRWSLFARCDRWNTNTVVRDSFMKRIGYITQGKNIEKDKNNNHNNYLFTGDTLFIDGIARPDLHNKPEEFTRNLFNTYHQKILNLPYETLILPAHFGGSFDHQKLISNTINSIKQEINLLSASEAEFIKFVTDNTSLPQPMNYDKIISINKNMILCNTIEQKKDIEAGPNACGICA